MQNESGVVLAIVVISLLMLTMVAGFATLLAYHQNRLLSETSGGRVLSYYRAQAGVVDALARIRNDYTVGMLPGGSFTDPAYDPAIYGLDIDPVPPQIVAINDAQMDVTVDIGTIIAAGPQAGLRMIVTTGRDTP